MEEILEINFIYSEEKSKLKTFLNNVPKDIECINYIDIYDKLAKNDYYDYEPSDAVVSTYIIREIQYVIDKNHKEVYYVLGCLEKDNIQNIQNYIKSLTDKDIIFNIYYSSDINLNGSSKLFKDLIQF
jgi:hypothetical protein